MATCSLMHVVNNVIRVQSLIREVAQSKWMLCLPRSCASIREKVFSSFLIVSLARRSLLASHLSTNTCVLDHWANCTMIVRCCCSILADDMGLGKTLQGVALIWTLLTSGHEALGGVPVCKRAMVVCPTSLVDNWNGEFKRWLQARSCYDAYRCAISATLSCTVLIMGENTMKDDLHVRAQHSCTTSPFRLVYPSAR
jgi:SNF2-related domain